MEFIYFILVYNEVERGSKNKLSPRKREVSIFLDSLSVPSYMCCIKELIKFFTQGYLFAGISRHGSMDD